MVLQCCIEFDFKLQLQFEFTHQAAGFEATKVQLVNEHGHIVLRVNE